MPTHMSAIGFAVETQQDFQEFASIALARGESLSSTNGIYVKWSPGNGVELWAQGDRNNTFVGLNPHFYGGGRMRVVLTERISANDATLDGSFYAWAGPEFATESKQGLFPFVFDSPDFDRHANLTLPCAVDLQISAFAHSIDIYQDDSAFEASQDEDGRFAPESFIRPDCSRRKARSPSFPERMQFFRVT